MEQLLTPEEDVDRYEETHSLCVVRWMCVFGQDLDREVQLGLEDHFGLAHINKVQFRDHLWNNSSFRDAYRCADAQEVKFKVAATLWWENFGSDGTKL